MAKISSIVLTVFWITALLFPALAISSARAADSFAKPPASMPRMSRNIIYTIKKNESLSQIAKYFGIDSAFIAELNSLKNPDLIYPGSKLTIQVQDDFSLRVTETALAGKSGLRKNSDQKQVIIQVTIPSRDDIFAPENPLVEVKEIISGPRRTASANVLVFQTLFDFVEWLVGDVENFNSSKAAHSPKFDPPSSGPYTISTGFNIPSALVGGKVIPGSGDNYQSPIANVSSPPPKSL